jgi:signal transduction histidine kinase
MRALRANGNKVLRENPLSTEKPHRSGFRQRTDESLRQERGRSSGGLSIEYPADNSYLSRVRSVTDACLDGERADVDEALSCLLDLLKDEELALAASENDVAVRESLIHTFSHELRTLLNAMTVNTDVFLKREGKTREKTGANIQLTVQRMERLLTNMIDLARLNRGKLNVMPRPHDAAALVEEAVETFGPLARSRSVSLSLKLEDLPLAASIDHDRVFQVLANLLTNAIDFSEEDGKVAVTAARSGNLVQVAVEDTGPGIEEKELPGVFERYRQLHRRNPRGLGLGLYISKSIVDAHGGKMWAASRPGAGSTFYFTVPGVESLTERTRPSRARSSRERSSLPA